MIIVDVAWLDPRAPSAHVGRRPRNQEASHCQWRMALLEKPDSPSVTNSEL
jgi:hypothetical protein